MSDTVGDSVTIDSFGLTDPGKVRESNEDSFLIVAIGKSVDVRQSSLSPESLTGTLNATSGHLFVVADGVGGRPDGEVASERTVAAVLEYVGQTVGCFHAFDPAAEHELLERLEATVQGVHRQLLSDYGNRRGHVPATTLTMLLLVWPRAYLVHVGDSRAYVRRRGHMQRLTRDQNLGEHMIAAGAWTEEQAAGARNAAVLSSAIGGTDLVPVVGLVDLEPGDSLMLCTDGLTRHVSDHRIEELLERPDDAQRVARQLVADALEAGGSDNVAVIVMRSSPQP
jgi:serine/threonine protein phosphatase PrpC